MITIDKITEKNFLEAEQLRSASRYKEAIKIFKKILKQYPNLPPALNSIALSYASLENFEKAEIYFKECMKNEPVPLVCVNNFAKLYFNYKKYSLALPLLQKSLSQNSQQVQMVEIAANCLFDLGMKKETDNFCKEMLKKFPDNKTIKYYYGKNLLRINKHQEGLDLIKESSGVIEFGEKKFKLN